MSNRTLAIVVNFKSEKWLKQSLPKLFATPNLDVVVINNSVSEIGERYLKAKIIQNKTNLGFAGGMNAGIKYGLKKGYVYFALLNPDTLVKKGWLEEALKTFKISSKVGIVQPVILLPGGKINTIGNDWHYLGFSTCRDYGREISRRIIQKKMCALLEHPARAGFPMRLQPTFFKQSAPKHILLDRPITCASGAALIISQKLINKIGLLEESYFMYGEDSEYSYRAWKAGYKVYLAAASRVTHDYSFRMASQKWFLLERNRLANLFSLYSTRSLIIIFPWFIISEIGLLIFSIVKGLGGAKIKSYAGIGLGLKLRSKRQKIAKLSERELKNRISGDVCFPFLNRLAQELFNLISGLIFSIVKLFW